MGVTGDMGRELGFLQLYRTHIRRKRDFLLMEKHVPVVCFTVSIWRNMLEDAYSLQDIHNANLTPL